MTEQEQRDSQKSDHFRSTALAIALVVGFYPLTIAPLGGLSNGGAAGLASLVIASVLAWRAFMLNRVNLWRRRFVQLPLTIMATYLAIADAVAQYRLGH